MVEAKQHGEHGWNHHQIADELNITPPARNNSSQVETVEATGSVRWCSAVPVASTTDAESPHDLGFAGYALFADGGDPWRSSDTSVSSSPSPVCSSRLGSDSFSS